MEEAQAEIFTQLVLEINYVVGLARETLEAGRQELAEVLPSKKRDCHNVRSI